MGRYFSPVLFLAAAVWVYWHNHTHADRVVFFPFLDVLRPSMAGDMRAQGEATVWILGGLGTLFLLLAIRRHLAEREEDGA